MTDDYAIRARGLVRRYGAKTALAGVDFYGGLVDEFHGNLTIA